MTSVKYFHSAMTGAPALNGTRGSLIEVLDACLVNGFGLQTATSVSVTSGVATVVLPSVHPFEVDTIAQVAGAAPSALNGEKRVIEVGANTIKFAAPGVTDQVATGTITVKLAPAGWAKAFAGSNKAVYRATDISGIRGYYLFDEAIGGDARVVHINGYEYMSDVDTGTGKFPSAAQLAAEYLTKSDGGNTTATTWTLVADGKTVYVHVHQRLVTDGSAGVTGCVYGFGDFKSFRSGDPYAAFLSFNRGTTIGSNNNTADDLTFIRRQHNQGSEGTYLMRSYTGIGGSLPGARASSFPMYQDSAFAGADMTRIPYPNGPDNSMTLARTYMFEDGTNVLRGHLRGLHLPVNYMVRDSFSWRDKVDGAGDMAGRKLLAIKSGYPTGTSNGGLLFFDITGPWE